MNNAKLQLEVVSPTTIKCGHIEWFALDTKLVGKVKALLEENKGLEEALDASNKYCDNRLKEYTTHILNDCKRINELQQRIDKAIEYIEKKVGNEIHDMMYVIDVSDVLDILRGKDDDK